MITDAMGLVVLGLQQSAQWGWSSPATWGCIGIAFAHSTQTVFYVMAGVMAATFVVAVSRLPGGRA